MKKLPAQEVKALVLRLHDAQSCIAREYRFASWADLIAYIDASAFAHREQATLIQRCLGLVYGADVTGTYAAARPRVAVTLLGGDTRNVKTTFDHDVPRSKAVRAGRGCDFRRPSPLRPARSNYA
jgi:hypothetical protein